MAARIQGAVGKPVPKSRETEIMMRVRKALWLVLSMFSLSLMLMVLGAYTTTRTESLDVTGYISGVILSLGSFLGLLGVRLEESRKQLLTAAIVFLSFGIISCFICVMIDGILIVLSLDMRPLKAERCQYYSSSTGYIYENFYTSVSCWNLNESCNMTFVGVRSCGEVFILYLLIWILTGLNVVALFAGILTAAVLGNIKDSRSSSPMTEPSESTMCSPTAPLLMDAHTHQLNPGAFMYFPPGEKAAASQSFPTSLIPSSEFNPPPFSPLTSLLS
ncbi:hypothetical protein Q8A73_006753 [Channa argus]|nr:hypothetical protein Q8A73_006753 [Channa argus]